MEPVGTDVFFLVPKAELLSGAYREIALDAGGALLNYDRGRMINSYEAVSLVAQPRPERLRAVGASPPATVLLLYLQLPKRLDPRVQALAQQVTASAPTAYDKAVAIETYLRATYGYTLTLAVHRAGRPDRAISVRAPPRPL